MICLPVRLTSSGEIKRRTTSGCQVFSLNTLIFSVDPSPDGSGILLCNAMEQKIQRTAGIASNPQIKTASLSDTNGRHACCGPDL